MQNKIVIVFFNIIFSVMSVLIMSRILEFRIQLNLVALAGKFGPPSGGRTKPTEKILIKQEAPDSHWQSPGGGGYFRRNLKDLDQPPRHYRLSILNHFGDGWFGDWDSENWIDELHGGLVLFL